MTKNNAFTLLLLSTFIITNISQAKTPDSQSKTSSKPHVTKFIILAAGFGTRFLPYTKAVPKEMLPIIDKPAIEYIVQEGIDAGITNFLMVTSKSKNTLENYFDYNRELERVLQEKNKFHLLKNINNILSKSQFTYIRQHEPLGTGHAALMAKHCIDNEYFAMAFPDDIITTEYNILEKLIEISKELGGSVLLAQKLPKEKVISYGVVTIKKQISENIYEISDLVEKPALKDAPSNIGLIGRYVLSHKVFDSIEAIWPENTGELQLTDAIKHMLQNGERVFVYTIGDERHDIGNPLGWLKAIIDIALKDPNYGPKTREYIKEKIG